VESRPLLRAEARASWRQCRAFKQTRVRGSSSRTSPLCCRMGAPHHGWAEDKSDPLAPYISTFICDEAQTLEHGTPRRDTLIAVPAQRFLSLTCTPLQNNLNDLHVLLQFACRGNFPGRWDEDEVDPI